MSVRWGFIGAGSVTERKASPTEAFTQEGSQVVAVARPDRERALAYAQQHGIPRAYDRVADLCADPEVDAVYVCTPHHLHKEHTLLAVRAGKHVLCEKPLANTTAECLEMVREAKRAGVVLAVAYYRRFYPVVERLRQIVAAGQLGTLTSAHVIKRDYYVPPRQETATSRRTIWRTDLARAGGGTLNESGSHRLDLLFYLLGEASAVAAEVERFAAWYAGEDQADVTIRFANRALAQVEISWCSRASCDFFFLAGTHGQVTIPDLEGDELLVQIGAGSELVRVGPRPRATHRAVVADFVRALADGGQVRCPASEGLLTTQLIEVAYEAARQKKTLAVPPVRREI